MMSAIKARLGKFETIDEFVDGYGQYFFRGGILLPTRHTREQGETVLLHLQISTGETVLRGEGIVKQVRLNSEGRTVGLVIRFRRLDARSKAIVDRIMDAKRELRASGGMPTTGTAPPRLRDTTTGQHLAVEDIGAIADAIDDTFKSIFGANAQRVDEAHAPDQEYLASLGGMEGFAVASSPSDNDETPEPAVTDAADESPTDEPAADEPAAYPTDAVDRVEYADDSAGGEGSHKETAEVAIADGLDSTDAGDDRANDEDDAGGFPGQRLAAESPSSTGVIAGLPASGGTMMMPPTGHSLAGPDTEMAPPVAATADDGDLADSAPPPPAADRDAVLAALMGEGDDDTADDPTPEYRDEDTSPPTPVVHDEAKAAPEAPASANHTMFGMPAMAPGPSETGEGAQQLARLGITQIPSTEVARPKSEDEPSAEGAEAGEERVKSFISALTGAMPPIGEGDIDRSGSASPAPVAPPTPPEDLPFGEGDVPAFAEPGETPALAPAVAPDDAASLRAAAERGVASAQEGEQAFDELFAGADDGPSEIPAALSGAFDAVPSAPSGKPEGLIGRFIAWLKGLFGG